MPMRSLEQWLVHQERVHPHSIDLGLTRLVQVLDRLCWRQPSVPVITVAGTNGKGSVVAYCAAMLAAAGYRVGTFTSPHLRDYRERIRINEAEVASDALVRAFERIEKACTDAAQERVSLTFFEYNALAALLIARGDADEAVALLARVPETPETRRLLAEARLAQRDDVAGADTATLLDALLDRVKDDPDARQEFLDLLETLGPDDPRTLGYRKALASRLF